MMGTSWFLTHLLATGSVCLHHCMTSRTGELLVSSRVHPWVSQIRSRLGLLLHSPSEAPGYTGRGTFISSCKQRTSDAHSRFALRTSNSFKPCATESANLSSHEATHERTNVAPVNFHYSVSCLLGTVSCPELRSPLLVEDASVGVHQQLLCL